MGSDHSKFAVFILTHGRPDNVLTTRSLMKSGYTGRIVYIIDNEDARGGEYRERFGAENVVEFDKAAAGETFDIADTQTDRRATVFARNASFQIARDLGLDYFVQLDDDYTSFRHQWLDPAAETVKGQLAPAEFAHYRMIRWTMDQVIEAMLTFLDDTGAASVAWSQGGDHVGAGFIRRGKGLLRKTMNSWFCKTDRPITFIGRMNDDVNTYIVNGARGDLFLTVLAINLLQPPTQSVSGGMTELYRASGTYVKTFYTVMMAPSCVQARVLASVGYRYHHKVDWDRAVPKILAPHHRKPR